MAGQLVVGHRGLAVRAVDEAQQSGVLQLEAFEGLEGLQANAVGGVGVAVVVHHLLSVAVGGGDLRVGQLPAQLFEAGVHSGQRFQRLLRFLGHVVADHSGLAGVGIGGDGLFQKGFHVRGVLISAGQLGGLLIGTVLRQQVHAGGDLKVADLAHRIRGGNDAACKAEGKCQCAHQCEKFLFHTNAPFEIGFPLGGSCRRRRLMRGSYLLMPVGNGIGPLLPLIRPLRGHLPPRGKALEFHPSPSGCSAAAPAAFHPAAGSPRGRAGCPRLR